MIAAIFADLADRCDALRSQPAADVVLSGGALADACDMGAPDMIAPRSPEETRTPAGERQRAESTRRERGYRQIARAGVVR